MQLLRRSGAVCAPSRGSKAVARADEDERVFQAPYSSLARPLGGGSAGEPAAAAPSPRRPARLVRTQRGQRPGSGRGCAAERPPGSAPGPLPDTLEQPAARRRDPMSARVLFVGLDSADAMLLD